MATPDISHLRLAPQVRVLMVCMGNICRSPTAQGVLEKLVKSSGQQGRIRVDSAGTHGYHIGASPDERSQAHAVRRGVDLSAQRARSLTARDFDEFDLVLVMDAANERAATAMCPPRLRSKLLRLTDFCPTPGIDEVPDPYYGGAAGFEHVLDIVEASCAKLMKSLTSDDVESAS